MHSMRLSQAHLWLSAAAVMLDVASQDAVHRCWCCSDQPVWRRRFDASLHISRNVDQRRSALDAVQAWYATTAQDGVAGLISSTTLERMSSLSQHEKHDWALSAMQRLYACKHAETQQRTCCSQAASEEGEGGTDQLQ